MNGYPTAGSPEEELASLKELISKQTAARETLHHAVASRDVAKLQAALPQAQMFLLDVEVQWGQRELDSLIGTVALLKGFEEMSSPAAEEFLGEAVKERSERPRSQDRQQELVSGTLEQQEEEAWREVQSAIAADDEARLIDALERSKGLLPDEKLATAHRKMPGIRARADMRKELAMVMKNPSDLITLKHVVFAARRSCLPAAEIEEAEKLLRTAEAEKKLRKAEAQASDARQQALPAAPPTKEPEAPEAAEAPKEPSKPAKAPQTKLELAVFSKDRELIQAAMAELRASGMTARETSHACARAMATFGSLS